MGSKFRREITVKETAEEGQHSKVIEYFSSDGTDNQIKYLYYNAFRPLLEVSCYESGERTISPGESKPTVPYEAWNKLNIVYDSMLTGARDVNFSEENKITFGDGVNGFSPPSGSNIIRVVYRNKEKKLRKHATINHTTSTDGSEVCLSLSSVDLQNVYKISLFVNNDCYIDFDNDATTSSIPLINGIWNYSEENILINEKITVTNKVPGKIIKVIGVVWGD